MKTMITRVLNLMFAFVLLSCFTIHAQTAELSVLFSEPTFDSNQEATVHDKNIRLKGKVIATAGFKFAMLSQGDKKSELHPSGDGMFQIDLELKEGVNEFMLGLADLSNNKEFLAFKINCVPQKEKATDITTALPEGVTPKGDLPAAKVEAVLEDGAIPEIFALIIGVSEFINAPEKRLKYAAKDANEYYQFIRSPEGGNVPEGNIRLLTNEQATKKNILKELKDMLLYADEDDIFMFYYSGHGQSVGNNQEFVLFPYDITTGSIDDIEIDGVTQTELMGRISSGRPGKKIMFIDACHSGMLASNQKGDGQMTATLLKAMAEADNTLTILTSSSDNEVSFEDDELYGGHGIFTYYLIEGLQGEADRKKDGNNDGLVTVYELSQYVGELTNLRAKKMTGMPQRPDKKCIQCNDFPLSEAGDYDIKKSAVQTPAIVSTPPKSETVTDRTTVTKPAGGEVVSAPVTTQTTSGGFKLLNKTPVDKEVYTQPAKKEDVINVVYMSDEGNKITFYRIYGDDYFFSGWINGEIIETKGSRLGNTIEFTDKDSRIPVKKGYLLLTGDNWTEMRATIEFEDGRKFDQKLQRLGTCNRLPLLDQTFNNKEKDIELKIYHIYGDDIYMAGHIGNEIVLVRGALRGDAILFVDNSKEWYCSGQLIMNNDWSGMRIQVKAGSQPETEYEVVSAGTKPFRQLDGLTYSLDGSNQTITFDSPYGNDIKFSGFIGNDYVKGKAAVRGDVLEVTDGLKNTVFEPTRFLLRDDASRLDIVLYYLNGEGVEVSLFRK